MASTVPISGTSCCSIEEFTLTLIVVVYADPEGTSGSGSGTASDPLVGSVNLGLAAVVNEPPLVANVNLGLLAVLDER